MSWINSAALEVKQQYHVPVNYNHYKDKIRCDVITMNVSQIILVRLWLFDKNITIFYWSNMCQFEHKSKLIKLLPLRSKIKHPMRTSTLALFPTPPSPPLITAPYLSLTNHAYPVHKPLPPFLPASSRHRVFESASAFASHKCIHKLYKEISDRNK